MSSSHNRTSPNSLRNEDTHVAQHIEHSHQNEGLSSTHPEVQLVIALILGHTHTSDSFAMRGLPTAMIIACAVVKVPDKECLRTVDVLALAGSTLYVTLSRIDAGITHAK